MEKPSVTDPAFGKFLEDLKKQNNQSFTTQLLQLKYEREVAKEDNDKREKQLDEAIKSLGAVKEAVTGSKVALDLSPLETALGNQTKILEKSLEELALIRKISEGSLEYDKESAQYRNTSGKELTSDVSGKTVKKGGYVDFETAANRLQGQGKRATEANRLELTPSGSTPIGTNTGQSIGANPKSKQFDPLAKKLSSVEVKPDDRTFSEAFKEIKSALTGGTFTAAKGRYSEEFVKAGKGTEEEGMGAYDRIVELEKKLEKSKEYGFEGSKEDREELTKLKDGSLSVANPRVQKRPDGESPAAVSSPNAEADNIQSTQEIIADSTKKDVELTGINNELLKKQLKELEKISAALAPKTPTDLPGSKLTPASGAAGGDGGGGGIGLGDVLSTGGGLGKTLKNAGKGALSLGGKALKFMGGKGGAIAGAALAVGAGAYTAYKGYTAADDSKDAKLKEVQAKVDSGEMKPEEAAAARKEIGNTATVEKSGAVGEGTGMAAGAVAGMKAGAMLGAFGGPIGAGVGALAGGALGAFAGSKGGKYIGEKVGSGINAVKGFFGGKTDDAPGAATKEAMSNVTSTSTKTSTSIKFNESEFAQKDQENYKKYTEFKGKRREEIARKDPFFKTDPQSAYTVAESQAEDEATAKFKAEIEAVNAGKITTTESKVTGGPGAKNPAPAVEKKPIDAAAPGAAAAVAMGAAQAAPSKGSGGDKFRSAQASALNQARQMVKNGEVGPGNIDEVTAQIMANVEGVSPQSADIIEKAVRLELQKGVANSSDPNAKKPVNTDLGDADLGDDTGVTTLNGIPKSRLNELAMAEAKKYGRKTPNFDDKQAAQKLAKRELPSAAVPAVEMKPVDAVAPGDATAAALAPGRAKGGPVEDGADYIVGEKGPELFMPFKDGVVIPNDVSKKIAGGKIPLAKGGIALADSKVKVPPIPKLPTQDGDQGDGSKVTTNPDGTKTYAGAFGRFTFDKSGKAIKYATPQFSGSSSEVDLTSGNTTTNYNSGPMSATQTTDAKGNVVSNNAEYDIGVGKMAAGRDAKGITTKSFESRAGENEDIVSNKDLYAAGNKDKEATYDRAMAQVNAAPAKTTSVGSEVVKASIENADLNRSAARGSGSNNTVVSNNVSSNNTTSYVPIKASPRSDGSSSVDRYQNRIAAY